MQITMNNGHIRYRFIDKPLGSYIFTLWGIGISYSLVDTKADVTPEVDGICTIVHPAM